MSTPELFAALVRQHGEENGGVEDFVLIDAETIGCRYGDTVIRRDKDGWRYGSETAICQRCWDVPVPHEWTGSPEICERCSGTGRVPNAAAYPTPAEAYEHWRDRPCQLIAAHETPP